MENDKVSTCIWIDKPEGKFFDYMAREFHL